METVVAFNNEVSAESDGVVTDAILVLHKHFKMHVNRRLVLMSFVWFIFSSLGCTSRSRQSPRRRWQRSHGVQ